MDANFEFSVDVPRNLVRITLGGFFSRDDISAFLAARERAHARLQCGPNEHYTLTDIREMKIQAQDIVSAWGDVLANPRFQSRRLAFVQASSLARIQLRRAAGNRFVRYFDSVSEAEQWLLNGDTEDAAAA